MLQMLHYGTFYHPSNRYLWNVMKMPAKVNTMQNINILLSVRSYYASCSSFCLNNITHHFQILAFDRRVAFCSMFIPDGIKNVRDITVMKHVQYLETIRRGSTGLPVDKWTELWKQWWHLMTNVICVDCNWPANSGLCWGSWCQHRAMHLVRDDINLAGPVISFRGGR